MDTRTQEQEQSSSDYWSAEDRFIAQPQGSAHTGPLGVPIQNRLWRSVSISKREAPKSAPVSKRSLAQVQVIAIAGPSIQISGNRPVVCKCVYQTPPTSVYAYGCDKLRCLDHFGSRNCNRKQRPGHRGRNWFGHDLSNLWRQVREHDRLCGLANYITITPTGHSAGPQLQI